MRVLVALAVLAAGCQRARPAVFDCAGEDCRDCALLAERIGARGDANAISADTCNLCQNRACGAEADGGVFLDCLPFPCVGGRTLVVGCNEDKDCPGATGGAAVLCGQFTAPHNLCVVDDAI